MQKNNFGEKDMAACFGFVCDQFITFCKFTDGKF